MESSYIIVSNYEAEYYNFYVGGCIDDNLINKLCLLIH